ncbi:maleylpyruvate isomerase N-terminal domain-containing protein [Actinoallomurus acaciae]|uniref:Maleylpyruvate isomerase N-terminal domain-containing protein n=1 Tax=Actinoallomurus acaciae TaxID=502577 RepID=A0ABV5YCG0_9ACTN
MSHLFDAAEAMAAVARTITDDQLANKTPCAEYDVRALVDHLLFWGPSLAGAGRKESVPQPAAAESDVDLAAGAAACSPCWTTSRRRGRRRAPGRARRAWARRTCCPRPSWET